MKVNKRNILMSCLTNVRPLIRLLIYNYSHLLSTIIFSFLGLITWVVKERLKEAFS